MDRIFNPGSIEQICEEIKGILNECKDHMETMRSTASEAQQAVAGVPSDVRDASVDTAAEALKSAISGTDLDSIIRKLDDCRTRACTLIPAADKQYGAQTDRLAQTVGQLKDAAEQMRQFLVSAPFAADYDTFRRSFDAACAGWRKVMEDADAAVEEILKNVKGAGTISTVFSKDPVNLSTGNFIYDRTDLEIPGSTPFTFRRFYNSVNDREGTLGKDWNHNYEVSLEGTPGEKVLVLEDGKEERFTLTSIGAYASIYQSDGMLEKSGDGFTYRTNGQELYRFDEEGHYISKEDANGNRLSLVYETAGGKKRLRKVEKDTGEAFFLAYGEDGYLREVKDHTGRTVQYEVEGNCLRAATMPSGHSFQYAYTPEGKLESVMNPRGIVTVENAFDEQHRTTRQTFPDGTTMAYGYDDENRTITMRERNGSKSIHIHDEKYRNVKNIYPDGEESFAYNAQNRKTRITDKLGHVTHMSYDEVGQLIRETNQLGDSRRYTYTPLGKIESITDEAGRITRYEYLPGGQLQRVLHSDGTKEDYTYDKNGNVQTYTNPSGFILSYVYDRLDRIIRIEGSEGERKEYTYDAVGNVTSMTDALGNRTKYEYSLTGQITKVIDPLGNETEYSYDVCDRLIQIRQYGEDGSLKEGADISGMDAELLEAERKNQRNRICHVTKYQRNLLGQVEAVTDALGLKEEYRYDPKGQSVEKLDKEGYLTRYGYTGQGDVSHIQYADGREVKYSYNPLRHLQEMEDWLGITRIATDPLGRAENVQYPDGKVVSYTYGKAGERTSITYPDGKTIHYGFDEQVRLSELRDGDSVITYGYDKTGRLAEKYFPNGVHTQYRYDRKGQIQELIHTDREGGLDKYTYQYDLLGNKTGIEKQRRGLEEESGRYQYGYDALGRLNKVTKDENLLRAYQYDAFGNRTRLTEQGKQTTYVYNNVNQLLSRVDAKVEETYTYDKRGNLSQITANGQIQNQYLYGALNRLEQAVNGKGEAARYQYNGLGHRVGKEIGKENIQTINDGLDPVKRLQSQTISPENQIQNTIDLTREYHNLLQKEEDKHTQTFLWDGNVAGMLEHRKDASSYYLQDELGSPIRLAGKDGNLTDSYGYDEFGQDLYGNRGKMQPFGYTGYQRDDVAGTYFAQAREYSPYRGGFWGRDLIVGLQEMPFTLNQYSYCFNNPVILVDLDGEWPSLSDFGEKIKGAGKSILNVVDKVGDVASKAIEGVVNAVKSVPWKQIGIIAGSVAAVAVVTVATGGVGTIGAALAIGATTGAAMGVSTRAATDIVLRQNSSWQEYVGDGIGGAVAGITTVLSPGIGTTAVGMMAGGTAATTTSILKGDPLHKTIINTIVGTTTGGVFGKIGGGLGNGLKNTSLAGFIRRLNQSGFENLGKIGARGNQAIQRVMATYLAYKTPSAIYNMLIQELGDFLNNHVEQCMEGS